ncbi:hypothetical protein ACHAXT_011836 [Thalassiosira profunda]
MPFAPSTSDHAVALPDGSTARYHLRGIRLVTAEEGPERRDDDVARWTQFCASVFSYKPNPPPPSYFARHFYNDPRRDAALVRVLVHCPTNSDEEKLNGEIVASVRIFRRSLSTGPDGGTIEAGGIGEVCTSPDHQRRGLSKILLKDALSIMSKSSKKEGGMKCSLLHANPDFRPVYAKVGGYASVRSAWSVVTVRLQNLTSTKTRDGWTIRMADCKRDAEQLQKLHREYSESRLITIVRSVQYWQEYVGAELGNTLWVLERPTDEGEKILAWISIRKRGDRYQLREFGADKREGTSVGTSWALRRLLGAALDQVGEAVGSEKEVLPLVMPTFVLSELRGERSTDDTADFLDVERATEENDDGWMYVSFDDTGPSVTELTTRGADPVPHLIWPTDSF